MYSSVYTKRISRRRNLAYQMIRCFSSHYTTNVSDIKFAYKFYPAKDPNIKRTTIFLHGLYGYKEEWNLVASDEQILNLTNCYIFDAVNHGGKKYFHRNLINFRYFSFSAYVIWRPSRACDSICKYS